MITFLRSGKLMTFVGTQNFSTCSWTSRWLCIDEQFGRMLYSRNHAYMRRHTTVFLQECCMIEWLSDNWAHQINVFLLEHYVCLKKKGVIRITILIHSVAYSSLYYSGDKSRIRPLTRARCIAWFGSLSAISNTRLSAIHSRRLITQSASC